MLRSWGETDERDIAQVEEAITKTKYTFYANDAQPKVISASKAIELLGNSNFLSGLDRSAFHWSAVRYIDDSDESKGYVYFDSSALFK